MLEILKHLEGRLIDRRFQLLEYLGGTDHSSVFLTDYEYVEGKTKKAAIKLIEEVPGHAEAQLIRWRLAAKFDHPHLLRIYHMDRCKVDGNSMLYVVMERAEENLADTLLERPLSQEEMHDVLGTMLDVLGYIHSKGFVHGHVQPSNIMAVGDQVKLSSDGICRIAEEMEHHNGRTFHSAPEYGTVAPMAASDIWSLGATIVDCLGGPLDKLGAKDRQKVILPQDLPAPFLEIARHCLVEDPRRRWDVAQLKAHLHKKAAPEPPVPVRPPVRPQVQPPVRPSVAPSVHPPIQNQAQPQVQPRVQSQVQPQARPQVQNRVQPPVRTQGVKKPITLPKIPFRVALTVGGIAIAVILIGMAFSHRNSNASGPVSAKTESAAVQPVSAPAVSSKAKAPQPARVSVKEAAKEKPREAVPPKVEALSVVPTGALVRGDVLHRVMPDVPRSASETIWGTVRVRVRVDVDPSGNVVTAKFDSPGPSKYFARLSLAAARQWKFRPPSVNGANVASEWLIHFGYCKTDNSASPVEQKP